MDEFILKDDMLLIDILLNKGVTKSKGEARRLITQGAVRVDGNKVEDINMILYSGNQVIIKVGKRKFLSIKWKNIYFCRF